MPKYGALTWAVFALGMGFIVYAFFAPPQPYEEARFIGAHVSGFNELLSRFQNLAREKGAEYAFEVLLRASLPPHTDLHLLGHGVGDVLYEQNGVKGIAKCTQDFRNACSHSLVIGALGEFGTEALPQIREACTRAPGGGGAYAMCFHGLGHGVFAYFDYLFPETVEFCKSTGTAEAGYQEFSQCVSGAVMELMGGGGHNRDAWIASREMYLDDMHPLHPCDTRVIPDETKALCLIYLTPRLFELAGADLARPNPATFPKAFSFCESLPENSYHLRSACYGGFGKEFVVLAGERDIRNVSDYSDDAFKTAISWCALAGNVLGERACLGDAVASIFWGGENNPDGAFRFCALVDEEHAAACYERLATDIQAYVRDDSMRETLCMRLPKGAQSVCSPSL